jgi:glycosyltransferase involved in cell wall biosynthesis
VARNKLDIWIVHTGEPLPGVGPEMHAAPLARELAARGHRVLWWNTAFDHFSKQWVYSSDTEFCVDERFSIQAIKGWGYSSNTSLRRFVDHRVVARRWMQLAKTRPRPDLMIVAMPPHDLAFKAVRFARTRGIPVILNLRDPWPDALLDLLPSWSRSVARLFLFRDFSMLRSAVSDCDSLVAVTRSLYEWGRISGRRRPRSTDRVIYTGARHVRDAEISEPLKLLLDELHESFVVVFVGTFGFYHSPSIAIEAARRLAGSDVHFVLAGSGNTLPDLMQQAADMPNVHFTGWLSSTHAAALMRHGKAGMCPTIHSQPILPNKAAAYLREGLPLISSFAGDLRQLIDERNVGINYDPGDVTSFVAAIQLLRNEQLRVQMSANARKLYREELDAENNLVRFARHAEQVATGGVDSAT